MTDWPYYIEDSRWRWDKNSNFWDEYMEGTSHDPNRNLIVEHMESLLSVQDGDHIVDVACGNGSFSRRLVQLGAHVEAFDYSSNMIERARERSSKEDDTLNYHVLDAMDEKALLSLGEEKFDRAVSNMALMDMAAIQPLFDSLYRLLKPNGVFVFSIIHPCFQAPGHRKVYEEEEKNDQIISRKSVQITRYIQPETYKGIGIRNQPFDLRFFHRPLHDLLSVGFKSGFVVDGMSEPVIEKSDEESRKFDWVDIPATMIIRLKK